MIHRSRAPLRIGLAGGGTDVSPFSDIYGGAILNVTINLYAHASITPRDDNKIVIHAIDRKERYEFDSTEVLDIDGGLDLQRGVYNRIVKDFTQKPLAFELTTYMDAPSGSGLGTSSTLVVAIIGAFVEWLELPLGEYDIAQLAYSIEREDLKMAGGKQDQYAATFGGVNFMEFYADNKVVVNPLRIKEEVLRELEFHLLLYYTEISRESAHIIEEQSQNVQSSKEDSIEATKNLKRQALKMKEVVLKNQLGSIGEILDYGWSNKKKMANKISNPVIDRTYQSAIKAGASGGKISGAGGGGFMIFYCPGNTKYAVMEALNELGGRMQPYNFVETGITTWTSDH
jgi:D-glycero-alpha-D-manno-heptose-7-phosphate kinase